MGKPVVGTGGKMGAGKGKRTAKCRIFVGNVSKKIADPRRAYGYGEKG